MSAQTTSYQYQPLPKSTSVRLVRVSFDDKTQDVSCKFEVVDLSENPAYVALSYCWGDNTVLEPTICDGEVIMVTPTIRTMLKHFSRVNARLWCDALCINQKDIPERNQQVSIMADIYSQASAVNVWLGPDTAGDANVLKSGFQKLFNVFSAVDVMGATFKWMDIACGELHATHSDMPSGAHIEFRLPPEIFWAGYEEETRLRKFFNLSWFSRTWVMQEVGLAANVNCFWGDTEMNWDTIGIIAMFLVRYGSSLTEKVGIAEAVANVYHLYTAYSPFTPTKTFFHLLNNSKRFEATDPRDKVFALLSHPTSHTISMASDVPHNANRYEPYWRLANHFQPSAREQDALRLDYNTKNHAASAKRKLSYSRPSLIKADYNKSTSQVYMEVTTSHIQRTNSLEILTAVQHDPLSPTLPVPSWVPRWDEHVSTPTLGLYTSMFTASSNRPPVFTLPSTDPSAPPNLTVRGTIVSRVIITSELLEAKEFDLPIFPDPDPALLASAKASGTPLKTYADTFNPIATMWLRMRLDTIHESGEPYTETILRQYQGDDGTWYGLRNRYSIWAAYLRTWIAGGNGLDKSVVDVEEDGAEYWWRLFPDSKPKPEIRARNGTNMGQAADTPHWEFDEHGDYDEDHEGDTDDGGAKAKEEYLSIMSAERYRAAAARVGNQRKFFMIKKGLFGLGPGAMQKGDWLAILLGADVPFILREVGAQNRAQNQGFADDVRFQLVGECFCFGLMEGQGARLVDINRDIVLV